VPALRITSRRARLGARLRELRATRFRSGSVLARQLGWQQVCEYQPAMMPGLVQTPAYAREMLSVPGGAILTGATPDSIEALIVERVKRRRPTVSSDAARMILPARERRCVLRRGRHRPGRRGIDPARGG
jgi:hypothetical protein